MKSIYLLQNDNGFYKIGVSKNPAKRVKQLQTGSADKISLITFYESNNAFAIERALKNRYSIYRINGEWFNLPLEEELAFNKNCEIINDNIKLLVENGNIFM